MGIFNEMYEMRLFNSDWESLVCTSTPSDVILIRIVVSSTMRW